MKLYAVRKRRGQWSVSSDKTIVLNFNSYHEAIGTAQTAAVVMLHQVIRTLECRLPHCRGPSWR